MLFKPCQALEPYISCYWLVVFTGIEEERLTLKPRTTLLVPDGGASLIFNMDPDQNSRVGELWGVMSHPVVTFNQLSISWGKSRTFGVDFKPAGLYRFCNVPMKLFSNISLGLESLSQPLFNNVTAKIIEAKSIGEQIRMIESFLLKLVINTEQIPPVVDEAINIINKKAGAILIKELTNTLLISDRHLNRLFHQCVGISPKTLCRITRLQKVIKTCRDDRQIDFLMAAYDNGYFDQSHFIKDFKELCGCTPGKYNK
jgi:AraC-like DNA-binding protein